MKNAILNLEGVTFLSKAQQKSVNGGQVCRITITAGGETTVSMVGGFSEGSAGSGQANNACLQVLSGTSASRCSYDCAHDGFGQ